MEPPQEQQGTPYSYVQNYSAPQHSANQPDQTGSLGAVLDTETHVGEESRSPVSSAWRARPKNSYLLGVGDNSRGQLAYGPIRHIDSISVLETADGTDYNRVFCGDSSAYAITDSGKVWAWGYSTGTSKELSTKSSLKQVEELADMFITQISVGHSTTVFLNDQGEVYQTGIIPLPNDARHFERDNIVLVQTTEKFKYVSAGHGQMFAQGKLYRWGRIVGRPNVPPHVRPQPTCIDVPALIDNVKDLNFIDVAAWTNHVLAVTEEGHLYSWGACDRGQLGLGVAQSITETPVRVPNVEGIHFVRVFCRSAWSAALDRSWQGRLFTWGASSKILGHVDQQTHTVTPTLLPLSSEVPFSEISGGDWFMLARAAAPQGSRFFIWGHTEYIRPTKKFNSSETVAPVELEWEIPPIKSYACGDRFAVFVTEKMNKRMGLLGEFIDAVDDDEVEQKDAKLDLTLSGYKGSTSNTAGGGYVIPEENYIIETEFEELPYQPYGNSYFVDDEELSKTPNKSSAPLVSGNSAVDTPAVGAPKIQIISGYESDTLVASPRGEPTPIFSFAPKSPPQTRRRSDSYVEQPDSAGVSHYGDVPEETTAYGAIPSVGQNDYSQIDSPTLMPALAVAANSYSYNISSGGNTPRSAPVTPRGVTAPTASNLPAALQTNGSDWNNNFQNILDMPVDSVEEKIERQSRLRAFKDEFMRNVIEIGRVIVDEHSLPDEQKTYPPMQVGGIAGGSKTIARNLFFKFAIDMHGIYGGDEWSRKAANLELLGLNAYMTCQDQVPGLRVPLMAVIDYKGYRVLATSVLPLNKGSSLVYGSDDGGRTCYMSSTDVNEWMAECGKLLNIKPHRVTTSELTISAPCDIEVHHGTDGRYYVLDTARVYPPEFPFPLYGCIKIEQLSYSGQIEKLQLDKGQLTLLVQDMICSRTPEGMLYYTGKGLVNKTASALLGYEIRGEAYILYGYEYNETPLGLTFFLLPGLRGSLEGRILYYQLRPEFVRQYKTALSSDACSMFGRLDKDVDNAEVKEATIHLKQYVIPNFAAALDNADIYVSSEKHLVSEMHKAGINLRYLGFLRSIVTEPRIKRLIFLEMIARCIKNMVKRKMRLYNSKGEQRLRQMIIKQFNQLFGNSMASKFIWEQLIKMQLAAKYHDCLQSRELDRQFDLRELVTKSALFQNVQHKTGVFFTHKLNATVEKNDKFWDQSDPLVVDDILDILPTSKVLNAGDKQQFRALLESKAEKRKGVNPFDLLSQGDDIFEEQVIKVESELDSLTEKWFGEESHEAATQHTHLALMLLLKPSSSRVDEAQWHINYAKTILMKCEDCEAETFIGICHALGRIYHFKRKYHLAMKAYRTALGSIARAGGTNVGNQISASNVFSEYEQAPTLHPSMLMITNLLCEIGWDLQIWDDGMVDWCFYFYSTYKYYEFPGNEEACRLIFGSALPYPIANLHKWLSIRRMSHGLKTDAPIEGFNVILEKGKELPISDPKVTNYVNSMLSLEPITGARLPTEFLADVTQAVSVQALSTCSDLRTQLLANLNEDIKVQLHLQGASTTEFVITKQKVSQHTYFEPDDRKNNPTFTVSCLAESVALPASLFPSPGQYRIRYTDATYSDNWAETFVTVVDPSAETPIDPTRSIVQFGYNCLTRFPISDALQKADTMLYRTQYDPWFFFSLSSEGEVFSEIGWTDMIYAGRNADPSNPDAGRELKKLDSIVGKKIMRMSISNYIVYGTATRGFEMEQISAAVAASGEVYVWGVSSYGALGVGDNSSITIAKLLVQLYGVRCIDVCTGTPFMAILDDQGQVYVMGALWACIFTHEYRTSIVQRNDDVKQISFGSSPKMVVFPDSPNEQIVQIASSLTHIVCVTACGDFYYCGQQFGYAEDSKESQTLLPWTLMVVEDEEGNPIRIKRAACGYDYTILLSESGQVYAFGENSFGQLGDGTTYKKPFAPKLKAISFSRYGQQPYTITFIDAYHSCSAAIAEDGTAFLWGHTITHPTRVPSPIEGDPITAINVCENNTVIVSTREKNYEGANTFEPQVRARKKPELAIAKLDESGNLVLSTETLIKEVNKAITTALEPVLDRLDALTKRITRIERVLDLPDE